MDWIDDLLDDRCNLYQISTIENLMKTSSVANEFINNPTDPKEQFKKMFRDGN